jgi:hypothetical protein
MGKNNQVEPNQLIAAEKEKSQSAPDIIDLVSENVNGWINISIIVFNIILIVFTFAVYKSQAELYLILVSIPCGLMMLACLAQWNSTDVDNIGSFVVCMAYFEMLAILAYNLFALSQIRDLISKYKLTDNYNAIIVIILNLITTILYVPSLINQKKFYQTYTNAWAKYNSLKDGSNNA